MVMAASPQYKYCVSLGYSRGMSTTLCIKIHMKSDND